MHVKDQLSDLRLIMEKKSRKKGWTIGVFGPKGGCGKTTVALNLALSFIQNNAEVLLIDFDLGTGNIEAMIGSNHTKNLYHYFSGQSNETEIIFKGPLGLSIIGGLTKGKTHDFPIGYIELKKFFNALEIYSDKFDFIIIDTGNSLENYIFDVLKKVDFPILITSPEPTSIHDTLVFLEEAEKRLQHKKTIHHLLNKIEKLDDPYLIETIFFDKCEEFSFVDVELLSYFRFEKEIFRTIIEQTPYLIKFPFSDSTKELKNISRLVMKICNYKKPVTNIKKIVNEFSKEYFKEGEQNGSE
ncbi:AAA family ATPase [bacterium]|nr:AAA family ATPase [bacterium]